MSDLDQVFSLGDFTEREGDFLAVDQIDIDLVLLKLLLQLLSITVHDGDGVEEG
jgi:hypothetical protein